MNLKLLSRVDGVAGTDEAGRGCLAGPVVAAAVVLPPDFHASELGDSKTLSAAKRAVLYDRILEGALSVGVGWASVEEIGAINILQASLTSMHRALDALSVPFSHIAVDGNRFRPYPDKTFECIVKGDGKIAEIAAASIIAKVYRDRLMADLHEEYPAYGWDSNKGYPTRAHRAAIRTFGATPHHRSGFKLLQGKLEFE